MKDSNLEILEAHSCCSIRDKGDLVMPTDPKHSQRRACLQVFLLCMPRLKHASEFGGGIKVWGNTTGDNFTSLALKHAHNYISTHS